MVIILDAYNILKQMSSHAEVAPQEIGRFIRKMAQRCHDKGYTAIAVFDGGSSRHVTRSSEGRLTIVYAGYHKSADDVILELIPEYCRHNECVLISADRKLRTQAELLGAVSIKPEPLIAILSAQRQNETAQAITTTQLQRKTSTTPTALDLLMEEAAATMGHHHKEEVDEPATRQRPGTKPSKSEKAYERIVSKL